MWKLGFVFIIVALGSTFANNIILECRFGDYGLGDLYMCSLSRITVLDSSLNVTFNGTHRENRTNADVGLVEIYNSDTPFIIHQLFTTFPHLLFLNIYDSNLASVVIPPEAQLLQLVIQGNNISKIESGSLRNQTQHRYLYLTDSGVTAIDEDAFEDLQTLEIFSLMNNKIQKLSSRTLAPLTNVLWINFHNNLLSIIDEDIFLQNTSLEKLYLGNNQIDQIHPRAFAHLRSSLSYIDLEGNQCVSQIFSLECDQDWTTMNNSLQRCFNLVCDTFGNRF